MTLLKISGNNSSVIRRELFLELCQVAMVQVRGDEGDKKGIALNSPFLQIL